MQSLKDAIRDGQAEDAVARVNELLAGGARPEGLLKQAMIPAMDEVGELFQSGEFFMPEMLIAARAMQRGLDVIKPLLADMGAQGEGAVVLGTVAGDMHDIGKNLVAISLEGAGFQVVDLGADVAPELFVRAVQEHRPLVVGISSLLTTTLPAMARTVAAIRGLGSAAPVRIMVGGAPLTHALAAELGADFYGPDSVSGRDFAKACASGGQLREAAS